MRKIFLTVNTDTADLRYTSSPADAITNPADAPQIYSGEEVIFCVSFIGADLQPVSFAETDTFDFGDDTNFDHTDNLMAYTDQINQAGDWSAADVTAGKISFRVSTATSATAEKLAALADLQVKLEIRQFSAGSTTPSVLCQAPAVIHNTVIGVDPSAPDAEAYLTAAQVTAITDALADDVTAAQNTADSKLTAPATAGTAGQVLTLSGGSPVWAAAPAGIGAWSADNLQERTRATTYTADTDGWLLIHISQSAYTWSLAVEIDGIMVSSLISNTLGDPGYVGATIVPVFAGQTYTVNWLHPPTSTTALIMNIYFAPCV